MPTKARSSPPQPILASIIENDSAALRPFLLLEYDTTQSFYPLARKLIFENSKQLNSPCIAVCLISQPEDLMKPPHSDRGILFTDLTVPDPSGNKESSHDTLQRVLVTVNRAPPGALTVFIDSADALSDDFGGPAKTFKLLKTIVNVLATSRPPRSRLILPLPTTSPLLPLLLNPSFSPSLVHIRLHSPSVISHIDSAFLTYPPLNSASPEPKFWNILIPLTRRNEGESIAFFSDLIGAEASCVAEGIAEVCVRDKGSRKGIIRNLEGWRLSSTEVAERDFEVCGWHEVPSLASLVVKLKSGKALIDGHETGTTPGFAVSFNLNLTATQQEARSQVPLPYAHEGKTGDTTAGGQIIYDPDSADDIDDEDPDEDLDL